MDVFAALEERVEQVVAAHQTLRERVAELEEQNRRLAASGQSNAELSARVAELERERNEVRARLEKLLGTISALEL